MKYLSLLLFLFFSIVSFAQDRILVDGIFDEWSDYPVIYTDAAGDDGFSGIDFGQLKIYNDEKFLFFSLEVGTEINLQNSNDVSIYLETDNNSNTGFSINGIGADLIYNFGNREGIFYTNGNSYFISHSDIGLINAPTVTSNRFEIAIKRDITLFGSSIFQTDNVKVVFKDDFSNGDLLPNTNAELEYTFSTDNLESLPNYSIQKSPASDLRILSYNVLSDGLFDSNRESAFTRILQATQPDIIGFQEIYDNSPQEVADRVGLMTGVQWYSAKQGPDCHAISRYPIIESAFIPGYNQNAGNGAFLVDLPGVAEHLLLIVAHPPCCSNDFGRQIEVDLIMEFLREAKNGSGPIPLEAKSRIVIVGDMNFVGDNRQLETLLTGDIADESAYGSDFNPDWDGSDLLDSSPYATGVPFSYTWYSPNSSFSPGRLDFIIYSGSNLNLQNSYSLFTPALPQDSLTTYNLNANDVITASDHLPLVADFKIENFTVANEEVVVEKYGDLKVYPNPSFGLAEVNFSIKQEDFVSFQLINQDGKVIKVLHEQNISEGEQNLSIDTSDIPFGVYFLKMKTSNFVISKKLIVVK